MLLRIDPQTGLSRQAIADRIGAAGVEFQARVAAAFDEVAAREPARFVVVDASLPVDVVVSELWDEISERWSP